MLDINYSFVLSKKDIPNISKYHNAIKLAVPEFVGFNIVGDTVIVELSIEPTQAIIDLIESIKIPGNEVPNVTPRQIRQAMILSGISLQEVENAIDTLPEPQRSLARTEWEYSTAFERHRPLVDQMGQMLGKTDEELDQLWIFAKTL